MGWLLRAALAAIALIASTSAEAGVDTWTPLGLYGGVVFSLAADPEPGGIVYAGTAFGGVYRSLDDGASWEPVLDQIGQPSVLALALDPATPSTVWAGTGDAGVWRSDDAGDSWAQTSTGLTSLGIRALAYDPDAGVLLAGTSTAGVFRSTDRGETWTAANTGLGTLNVSDFALATGGAIVYLSSTADGVFRSADGGQTWTSVSAALPDPFVTSVAVRSDDPDTVFAGTLFQGLQISKDGGQSWTRADLDLPIPEVRYVGLHRDAPDHVWVGTRAGLYRSIDGGASFEPTSVDTLTVSQLGLRAPSASRVIAGVFFGGVMRNDVASPAAFFSSNRGMLNVFAANIRFQPYENAISAGSNQGVHLSFNSGQDFFTMPPWDGPPSVFAFELDPNALGRWYVATEEDGLVKTDYFGFTWDRKNHGLVPPGVSALLPDPADPTRLLATSAYRGVFTTTDDGRRWQNRDLRNLILSDLAADPASPGRFYVASNVGVFRTDNGGEGWSSANGAMGPASTSVVAVAGSAVLCVRDDGLYRSVDGGGSWSPVDVDGVRVLALAVDPSNVSRVYAGTAGAFVLRSLDGGATFDPAGGSEGDAFAFSLLVTPAGEVLAGTLDGVRRSVDGGASWQVAASTPETVVDLAADPANALRVFGAAGAAGLLASTDGGATFALADLGADVRSVAAAPGDPDTVLVGTAKRGVLATSDGGITAEPRFEGMSVFVDSIGIDPAESTRLFAGTIFTGLYRSLDGADSWEQVGLSGRVIPSLHVPDGTGRPILAGTDDGVFASEDGGDTWFKFGLDREFVLAIENHPAAPGTLYVSTAPGELYRSPDGGETFTRIQQGLSGANLIALAGDPFDARTLFAGAEDGVFRSTDAGERFTPVGSNLGGVTVLTLGADPFVSGRVFAGTNRKGLFRSPNGGDNWAPLDLVPPSISLDRSGVASIAAHPGDPGAVYIGLIGGEILRTVDSGESFEDVSPGGPGFNPLALAGDPFDADRLFTATDAGVKRSTDRGRSWSDANGLPGAPVLSVAADPLVPDVVYAGTHGLGLYRSTDSGATFSPRPVTELDLGLTDPNALALLVHPADPDSVWVGASSGRVFVRTPLAQGFVLRDLGAPNVLDLAGDPANADVVYAATEAGVYWTRDRGETWEGSSVGLTESRVFAIAVDPLDPTRILAGTNGAGVFVSLDGANTWAPLGSGLGNSIVFALAFDGAGRLHAATGGGLYRFEPSSGAWLPGVTGLSDPLVTGISADPLDPDTVYAAVPGRGVYRTSDGGAAWAPLTGVLPDPVVVTVHAQADGMGLLAGTVSGGVARSLDDGASWITLDAGLDGFMIRDLVAIPGRPLEVLAAALGGGVARSLDGGASFTPLTAEIAETIFSLAFDGSGRLYVATSQGAFRSADQGQNWTRLEGGLPEGAVPSLTADPTAPGTLFAISASAGLSVTSDAGDSWSPVVGALPGTVASIHHAEVAGLLFAGSSDGDVYRSEDDGESWTTIAVPGTSGVPLFASIGGQPSLVLAASTSGLQVSSDAGLAFTPRVGAIPDIIFRVVFDGSGAVHAATDAGHFVSVDGGDTWQGPSSDLPPGALVAAAAKQDVAGTVVVATGDGAVFRTTNGGASWSAASGLAGAHVTELHASSWQGLFYAAADDGRMFVSIDGGGGWYPFQNGTQGLAIRAITTQRDRPQEVQLATDRGLYLSHDIGVSFASRRSPLGLQVVNDLTPVASLPERIYAATSDGVYVSDDAGRSFERRSDGLAYVDPISNLTTSFAFEIALNPYVPDRLFAATPGGGVFRSNDGGFSWAPMNQGLPFRRVIGISVDPLDPNHVIAGCEGGGLHEITLSQ